MTVTDEARKGLLGKGGVLMVTSHADRTSPVARGKWILDNLLGGRRRRRRRTCLRSPKARREEPDHA